MLLGEAPLNRFPRAASMPANLSVGRIVRGGAGEIEATAHRANNRPAALIHIEQSSINHNPTAGGFPASVTVQLQERQTV